MLKNYRLLLSLVLVFTLSSAVLAAQMGGSNNQQSGIVLTITGTIAHTNSGYIIRGETPAEVFTIVNPDSGRLDKFVSSGQVVKITAKSTVGDNVTIVTIDGQDYQVP